MTEVQKPNIYQHSSSFNRVGKIFIDKYLPIPNKSLQYIIFSSPLWQSRQ